MTVGLIWSMGWTFLPQLQEGRVLCLAFLSHGRLPSWWGKVGRSPITTPTFIVGLGCRSLECTIARLGREEKARGEQGFLGFFK